MLVTFSTPFAFAPPIRYAIPFIAPDGPLPIVGAEKRVQLGVAYIFTGPWPGVQRLYAISMQLIEAVFQLFTHFEELLVIRSRRWILDCTNSRNLRSAQQTF